MKRILITGANSYIGTSFEKYIAENFPNDYVVDTVDMIDGGWREKSFAGYDSVFHVAGIAHQKETKKNAHLYYEVNRDLAIETARKAKSDGVKQFIFLSSMSVYGLDTGVITRQTSPNPRSHYGKSKWEAEQAITPLTDENFKVCILRPPMVYGPGCKGNYQTLVKIAALSPVLPNYFNQRSMVQIDLLSEFVRQSISKTSAGFFIPQDKENVCTSEMMMRIRAGMNKKFAKVGIFNPLIRIFSKSVSKIRKAFGDLVYIENDE